MAGIEQQTNGAIAPLHPHECTQAGQLGGWIKNMFGPWCRAMAGRHLTARLTGSLLRVMRTDTRNEPGRRCVADGELRRLEGFEFNEARYPPALSRVPCRLLRAPKGDQVLVKTDGFMADVFLHRWLAGATHYKVGLLVAAVPLTGRCARLYKAGTDSLLRCQRAVPPLQVLVDLIVDETPVLYLAALAVSFFGFAGSSSYAYQKGRQDLLRVVRVFSA